MCTTTKGDPASVQPSHGARRHSAIRIHALGIHKWGQGGRGRATQPRRHQVRGLCGIGPTQPKPGSLCSYKPPKAAEATPSQWRGDTSPSPSLDLSLYLMPAFGGDDASATFPKHRPVSTGPALQAWPPATLWLSPRQFYVIRLSLSRLGWAYSSPIGRQDHETLAYSLTRGGQQQKTEAAGVSALAGSPQPSSLALPFVAHTPLSRPANRESQCCQAWLSP